MAGLHSVADRHDSNILMGLEYSYAELLTLASCNTVLGPTKLEAIVVGTMVANTSISGLE
jgi:hypothetical protein